MNRKYLLGGALLTTLGLAGAPWIEEALGGGDALDAGYADEFDGSFADEFDTDIDGTDEFAVEDDFTDGSGLGSAAEGEPESDELAGLLSAVESLGAGLRGGSDLERLFEPGGDGSEAEALALTPSVDADALRERFPLSSLVLGRGRAVAQLGGELATVGSVLSDGRTRVRRITERGVELGHEGQTVWVALPPVRYVPSATPAFEPAPAAAPVTAAAPESTGDPLFDL